MRILVTGATGLVGTKVVEQLLRRGHHVVVSTRSARKASEHFKLPVDIVEVNPREEWPAHAFIRPEGAIDGIINLMGENIAGGRWTTSRKQLMVSSRVEATKKLLDGAKIHAPNLSFFSSASAIGYYPINRAEELDESSAAGTGYLADLCKQWEDVVQQHPLSCRKIISRIGVVFSREGGALGKLLPIFKLGGGGPIGNGSMNMSWIHVDDLAGWLVFSAENNHVSGLYNAVAGTCSNREMTKSLAQALRRPAFFPVPPLMLKLVFGEMSCIMLDSQSISNKKLLNAGYKLRYPQLNQAMEEVAAVKTIIDGPQPHHLLVDKTFIEKKK